MTERLEIVNAALLATGVSPVSTADSDHPAVQNIDPVINKVSKQVQKKGWWFNKDYHLTLSPNTEGKIVLPSNTLSVDPSDSLSPLVRRGGFLYDTVAHTFVISETVDVHLVSELSIEDLPESAGFYILERVVFEYYVNDDGDPVKARTFKDNRDIAWIELRNEELKNADINSHHRPASQSMRAGVQSPGQYVSAQDPTNPGGKRT